MFKFLRWHGILFCICQVCVLFTCMIHRCFKLFNTIDTSLAFYGLVHRMTVHLSMQQCENHCEIKKKSIDDLQNKFLTFFSEFDFSGLLFLSLPF